MIINRVWCMPNSLTFSIKPIKELIDKYKNGFTIDPFARDCKIADSTNDLDPSTSAQHHMDYLDFLKTFDDNSVDTVLFDPPYSLRQVSECYKKVKGFCTTEDTQSSPMGKSRKELTRIVKKGGYVISFGWSSNGVGKKYGFEIVEILLVPHGGSHHDTICVVEKKIS